MRKSSMLAQMRNLDQNCPVDTSEQWSRRGVLAALASLVSMTVAIRQTSANSSNPASAQKQIDDALGHYAMISAADLQKIGELRGTPIAERIAKIAASASTKAPNPQPVLQTAGLLPGEGLYDISINAANDLAIARDLALHGIVNRDRSASRKAADYIQAWADIYKPSLIPINETKFDALIIAYDLLPQELKAVLKPNVAELWSQFAFGYRDKKLGGMTASNNFNSHRVKLLTLSAFLVGDSDLIATAHSEFETQLMNNISPDGIVKDFYERDAIHYVVYSLEPLMFSALAGHHHQEDWWADQGGRLAKAVAWLLPYVTGAKQHDEFSRSPVGFDKKRAMAGIAGYSGLFNPHDAGYVMALAARFEPELYTDIAKASSRSPAWLDALMPFEN